MRKFLLILLIFIYKNSFSQLNDNFSDADFTTNPAWAGSADAFLVNPNLQLQSKSAAVAQRVYLSTPSALALNAKWEFYLKMAFDPSTSNYTKVYLTSDNADLNSSLNGYFVQVGESGNTDGYHLYKQTGTTITRIISGFSKPRTNVNEVTARISVTRDDNGLWDLRTDVTGGTNFISEGTVTDTTHQTSSYFGIKCVYTASRSDQFFFDDFKVGTLTPDVTPALLTNLVPEANKITLTFNEAVDKTAAEAIGNYVLNPGNIVPSSVSALGRVVVLNFGSAINDGNKTLTINHIKDLSNNLSPAIVRELLFNTPATHSIAKQNEVLINEVLFNPRGDGADFVELYNNTDKTFDFKDLYLATVNSRGVASSMKQISNGSLLFLPHTYMVLTANPENVKTEYFTSAPDNFIKLATMPGFNNDKGTVLIINKDSLRIDQLDYTEKMHFPLLKDADGVSLERRYFDEATGKPGNFGSAAASVGFATPGYKNSQYLIPVEHDEVISFSSKTFSPDNDGFEDILTIKYNINQTGYVANVNIFDDNGRLVKKLISNETVASTGSWLWDGLNLNSAKVKTGIYIVYTEFFNLNGEVKRYKNTVTLASKFN